MVFDVYKEPIVKPKIKDLCVINIIEGEKRGVINPPKTSLDYLIERPKLNLLFTNMMKVELKKEFDLESENSRGQK